MAPFAITKCTNGVWRCGHCRIEHKRLTAPPVTPAEARDLRWDQAKVYRDKRMTEPLAIPGVVSDEVIVADCDPTSQEAIFKLVQGATMALMTQSPFEITFTAHDNRKFTVGAEQTAAIGAAVLEKVARCHAASQAIRDTLDAALASGATADEIAGIDITAGYPDADLSEDA